MIPPLVVLAPQRSTGAPSGGYFTHVRLAAAVVTEHEAHLVHYDSKNVAESVREHAAAHVPETLLLAGWGPHVPAIAAALAGRRFVYWAHSVGWFHTLPAGVPVLCVSRYTLGAWGELAPDVPLHYLPNPLGPEFVDDGRPRDVDVLIQERKASAYVLDVLRPRLESAGLRVMVPSQPVESLAALFNRAKVFVYDSRDYWLRAGVSEGFGLPPLEALACGCHVFTSVNAGLSDYIDPAVVGDKIGNHSVDQDVERIVARCAEPRPDVARIVAPYRSDAIAARWRVLASDLDAYFSRAAGESQSVRHEALSGPRVYRAPAVPSTSPLARRLRGLADRARRH